MKNRQPLSRLFIQGEPLPERYTALIADELNVKAVEYIADASALVDYEFKPQMRTLGPRLGQAAARCTRGAQDGGWQRIHGAAKGRRAGTADRRR